MAFHLFQAELIGMEAIEAYRNVSKIEQRAWFTLYYYAKFMPHLVRPELTPGFHVAKTLEQAAAQKLDVVAEEQDEADVESTNESTVSASTGPKDAAHIIAEMKIAEENRLAKLRLAKVERELRTNAKRSKKAPAPGIAISVEQRKVKGKKRFVVAKTEEQM